MQRRLTLFLAMSLLCSLVSAANLTDAQKEKLQQLLPGTTLSERTMEQMADIFYTREMPVRNRLQAISKLVGFDQMPKGSSFSRTICIWDIAGRNGPVFNAAMEQRALAREMQRGDPCAESRPGRGRRGRQRIGGRHARAVAQVSSGRTGRA